MNLLSFGRNLAWLINFQPILNLFSLSLFLSFHDYLTQILSELISHLFLLNFEHILSLLNFLMVATPQICNQFLMSILFILQLLGSTNQLLFLFLERLLQGIPWFDGALQIFNWIGEWFDFFLSSAGYLISLCDFFLQLLNFGWWCLQSDLQLTYLLILIG